VKFVGIYRSATGCSPCKDFTPKLAKIYREALEISESFRIVYLSCDGDEDEFNEYRSTMPWPAIPFHS
jgi:nucleoredoxin